MKNLIIVFNKENFSKSRSIKNSLYLPLSIETLLYCEINKLPHLNPLNYFKNEDHKKGQIFSEQLLKKIIIKDKKMKCFQNIIKMRIRYMLNFLFLFKTILKNLCDNNEIEQIYISDSKIILHEKSFNLMLLLNLIKINKKVIFLKKIFKDFLDKNKNFYYKLDFKKFIKKEKFDYIFYETGYNFRKILLKSALLRKKLLLISRENITFYKKIILKILNIKYLEIKKNKQTESNLKFYINNTKYKSLLKYLVKKFLNLVENCYEETSLFDKLFSCNSINYAIVNNSYAGSYALIYSAKKFNCKTILISHGTLSKTKKKESIIYNKLISENLYSKYIDYDVKQSKISGSFKFNNKIKALKLGNLIYSDTERKKKKYILYGVTSKANSNIHFWGQDLFFEFYNNLKFLNYLAKCKNLKILVKLHPNYQPFIKDFRNVFGYLLFSNKPINILLKNAEMCISFSSTVIEDSILSKVPVILFDNYNRYNHFYKSQAQNIKNCPIYYVNKSSKLLEKINIIKKSKNINFDSLTYSKDIQQSYNKFLRMFV